MLDLLWLIPALPLAGFLLLTLIPLPRFIVAVIGPGTVGLAALLTFLIGQALLQAADPVHIQTLGNWLQVGGLTARFALYLDPLSLVMTGVVTGVGFLIHLYAAAFMASEEGYRRFFAIMNLFVATMLILVLADDVVFLYLGWEGVGLCSYLLIGFWYRNPANGYAARKAFIVTRVGDVALLLGLLLLFTQLGTLDIQTLLQRAGQAWPTGSGLAVAAALLILGGALGKSAQLPLQTWLPDAMAGPTPVSALIHAATMVTAGVYLIARTHPLFMLAPSVQTAVAGIGALTLLLAGLSALTQRDIKRILAYSTISQIGYMFLALGVGAWSAAIFHLMTHAFFKALLFLAAGVVILRLGGEHDIHKMGGLRHRLPLAFWGFLIGAASLASLPLVTAGFYSKDPILLATWASGAPGLWLVALLGAVITAMYSFRPLFIVFYGTPQPDLPATSHSTLVLGTPVVVLSVLALVGGFISLPLELPISPTVTGPKSLLQMLTAVASLGGLYLAYRLFLRSPEPTSRLGRLRNRLQDSALPYLADRGWGFDGFYRTALVKPFVGLARLNRYDWIDRLFQGIAYLCQGLHYLLIQSQSGRLRWYAASFAGGVLVILTLAVWL